MVYHLVGSLQIRTNLQKSAFPPSENRSCMCVHANPRGREGAGRRPSVPRGSAPTTSLSLSLSLSTNPTPLHGAASWAAEAGGRTPPRLWRLLRGPKKD